MSKVNSSVVFEHPVGQWLNPMQLGTDTLFNLSTASATMENLLSTLKGLTPDNYLAYMIAYYEAGMKNLKGIWTYCDLLTCLQAAANILKPINYLEIGVRRGRSLAVVATASSTVNITGFDLWVENYAGMENPGSEFVASELKKIGHRGKLELISGDSKITVPDFFKRHPELYFDMITVDGDHSEEGARIDLQNVIPHLKMGGVLFFDDICHPQHMYLEQLWDEIITNNPHFVSRKYKELGYGIAFAIRRSF